MLLIPDPTTAFIDPYYTRTTLSLICSIADPVLGEPYARDPRFVAQKAERHLVQSGIADVAYFGPEAEFFVFDHIAYEQREHRAFYEIDSAEGFWNTGTPAGSSPNLAYKLRQKEGYFPVPPADSLANLRSEMVAAMESLGIRCEFHHHEVSSGGQGEIDMRFQPLLKMADQMMIYKYVVKNTAAAAGKTATFMPKPIFEENGSGMHVHQSLWKDGEPLMYGQGGYAHLSDLAKHYIAGLLTHAPALLAFCAPTTNSYRRLVPGYEAPVNLVYSARNRSACVRVPMYHEAPKTKRIEFRSPDPTANPYLAFSALMLAGLDGIKRQLDPGEPLDADIYELPEETLAKIGTVPSSLEASLRCARGRSRVPDRRGRVHRRADRGLHPLQAGSRGGRDPDAAAPVGVRAVPRRVVASASIPARARRRSAASADRRRPASSSRSTRATARGRGGSCPWTRSA